MFEPGYAAMAIYAARQTCSEQVMFLVNPGFAVNHTLYRLSTTPQCRRRLPGWSIRHWSANLERFLKTARIRRHTRTIFSMKDGYRFSAEGIRYLCQLIKADVISPVAILCKLRKFMQSRVIINIKIGRLFP